MTTIPKRSEINPADTWDLTPMYADDAAWEADFANWASKVPQYAKYKGTFSDSPSALRKAIDFHEEFERQGEKIGTYAFLKHTEDVSDSKYQGMKGRYIGIAAQAAEADSYARPEIMAIPDETMQQFLQSDELQPYKRMLEQVRRFKPHTLSEAEERILALQMESSQTANNAFDQLTDADMTFGNIEVEPGKTIELSHASYAACLENPNREVRKTAFHQYYKEFADHANTLAATLAGSIKQDVYYARVRNYNSAREAGMFPDNVPTDVYDNLVSAVRGNLPYVHKYYDVRRRAMKLNDIHFYDVYVPILSDVRKTTTWETAVEQVITALQPLGNDYVNALSKGLRGRWCDRYENKGKMSGAFSAGCYDSEPYILMNYNNEVLDHVFTLAHEAGHSMHSYFSRQTQPHHYSSYTIFVAEVASTFNEQLLGRLMMANAKDDREKAYFVNKEIDDIRKTIVRQTMFAEFEKITHALAEANEPLTLDSFKTEYRKLLDAYFGPNFVIDDELSLECLRIPHFYRAFYVYKYSTGLAAAIALSDRVVNGGQAELDAYLNFLKGGSSKDPLDLLRDAGVDMSTPEPINAALKRFNDLVEELDGLLN